MAKCTFLTLIFCASLFSPFFADAKANGPASPIAKEHDKYPTTSVLVFTPNMGQVADNINEKQQYDVLYTATNGSMKLFLFSNAISYQFTRLQASRAKGEQDNVETSSYRFSLELEGSNSNPVIRHELKNSLVENFYFPHCKDGITGVPTYGRLVYENVYPGIDWVIYVKDNSLEYDFVVGAGADISKIRMKIKGGGAYLPGS